jgi:hypothetical protein
MAQPPVQPWLATPPRRRRRFGLWQSVLGLVLILFVVLAVGDRIAAAVAAGQLRSRVATELAAHDVSYATLDVSIGGVPFLTQVAEGRYKSIAIDMTAVHVSASGRQATLPRLHVDAQGVEVDTVELARGHASATAEEVTGSGVIAYDALSGLIDLSQYHLTGLAFEDRAGALYARADVNALGMQVPIEAAADVSVRDGDRIEVRLRNAQAVGVSVPETALPLLDMVANAVLVANVPSLPFSITIDDIQATPDGLGITATGHQVELAR